MVKAEIIPEGKKENSLEKSIDKNKELSAYLELEQEEESSIKVEPLSCFLYYIIEGKSLRNFIPDYELYLINESFYENLNKSHDSLFILAKISCHEHNYSKALDCINKAITLSPKNDAYKLWKTVILLKVAKDSRINRKKVAFSCCGPREENTKKTFTKKVVKRLHNLSYCIETFWGLIEVSLSGVLKENKDIEPARYYSTKIKEIDSYYGYLAWAYIYLKEKKKEAIKILTSIINAYPKRPESYYLAINYYFREKLYEDAKEVSAEAFIKVVDPEYSSYIVLFSLKLARAYFYTGSLNNCLELLHKKYFEYPKYTVFLYNFAKYCVLSEDYFSEKSSLTVLSSHIRHLLSMILLL